MIDKREPTNPPFLLPCPICNGVEGCDHTVLERARAESERRRTAERTGGKTMRAFAIAEQKTLKTVYVGLHESEGDAWHIFLGWPDEAEIREAKMRFVCQEVNLYPTAQRCHL